jgi:hypothetical protein|tara:strand:- start:254 stop:379 length:126 start_codon:yes stop_codon:yes gene_type:complete
MTLHQLRQNMVQEELWMWSLFYEWRADQEQQSMNKAKTKRR